MMPPGGVWCIDRRLFTGVRGREILRSSVRKKPVITRRNDEEARKKRDNEHSVMAYHKHMRHYYDRLAPEQE
jgi:hypothetical protein